MNGELRTRVNDWRTLVSTSAKASAAQCGRWPVSASMPVRNSSSEKVSIPQSV